MTAENSPESLQPVFEKLLSDGYCIVRLSSVDAAHLARLYQETGEFFGSDIAVKERYSVPNRISGYRPHGYAHAGSPDKPDLNDSFLYWPRRRESLPHQDEIGSFLDAAEAYRAAAARIGLGMVEALCAHFEYAYELPFENDSFLQLNSFAEPTDRDLLQQEHEDAILLTVISTSSEGLERIHGENIEAVILDPDQVLVMAGSVLTMMTGGAVKPCYHQVRNHGDLDRKSIMYFISPDTTGPIKPFVLNDENKGVDIRALVIDNPQTFGLSGDFLTA